MKKSKTRIFISKSLSANILIYIKDKQFHFLKNVIRIKINEEIDVFDGTSGEWKSKVISINRSNIVIKIVSLNKIIEKENDIWLVFSPIKPHRMNIAIQKATELGVSRILPCITEYTNIRKINLKNLCDNAIEAAEQSERLDVPKIDKEINLNDIISNWPRDRKIFFCDENRTNNIQLLRDALLPFQETLHKSAVLIGPEGGFSKKDRDIIMSNKCVTAVSLGNKVLRSDTAITVALFSIQQILSN